MKAPKLKTLTALLGIGGFSTWLYQSQTCESLRRTLRSASVAAQNAVDYRISLANLDTTSDIYLRTRSEVHKRGADRLLELCRLHGGVFTKAGQYLASLTHVLPPEYTSSLAALQDKALPRPFEDVVAIFQEDLGVHPDSIFCDFDKTPLAAASLAQVHKARLKENGKLVAVKIQYPKLSQLFARDIGTMSFISSAISFFFPEFNLQWIVEEFRRNILLELNFVGEGHNAERVARNFASNPDVTSPQVEWKWTRNRVLVMEFINGCKVDDVDALNRFGFDPQAVSRILCEAFGSMVFEHGFVHGDAHAGNVFVRPMPQSPKRPQVVFLDNGLYRELDDRLRLEYCRLWTACITLDENGVRSSSQNLGVAKYFRLFPLFFTFRSLQAPGLLGQPLGRSDVYRELGVSRLTEIDLNDFINFFSGLPQDLLLLMKSQNLIRCINKNLGGKTKSRLRAFLKHSVRGQYVILGHNQQRMSTFFSIYRGLIMFVHIALVSLRLWFLDCLIGFAQWKSNCLAPTNSVG